jgi:hypothetical protein
MDGDGTVYWPSVVETDGCMQWKLCPVWEKLPVCDTCHRKIMIDEEVHHHGQADRCDKCEHYLQEKA